MPGLNTRSWREYLAQQPQPAPQPEESPQQQLEPEQQPQHPPPQQHDEAQQAHEQEHEQPAQQPLAAAAVVEEPTPENESMAADMRAMSFMVNM